MRPNGPGASFHVWSPISDYVTWRRTARAVAIMAMTVALGTAVSAAPVARPYRYGPAGLGSLGYHPVRYPGFTVRPQAIEPGA